MKADEYRRIQRHGEAVSEYLHRYGETKAHTETLSKLYDARVRIDELEAKLAIKDGTKAGELSHPIRISGTVWGCSKCRRPVPTHLGVPKFPRCPYCGTKYSGHWKRERVAIEQKEKTDE